MLQKCNGNVLVRDWIVEKICNENARNEKYHTKCNEKYHKECNENVSHRKWWLNNEEKICNAKCDERKM